MPLPSFALVPSTHRRSTTQPVKPFHYGRPLKSIQVSFVLVCLPFDIQSHNSRRGFSPVDKNLDKTPFDLIPVFTLWSRTPNPYFTLRMSHDLVSPQATPLLPTQAATTVTITSLKFPLPPSMTKSSVNPAPTSPSHPPPPILPARPHHFSSTSNPNNQSMPSHAFHQSVKSPTPLMMTTMKNPSLHSLPFPPQQHDHPDHDHYHYHSSDPKSLPCEVIKSAMNHEPFYH